MKSSAIYTPNAYEVICRVARMAEYLRLLKRNRTKHRNEDVQNKMPIKWNSTKIAVMIYKNKQHLTSDEYITNLDTLNEAYITHI